MSAKKATAAPGATTEITYADKVFTSRTLFLSGDRPLVVVRGGVSVAADDAEALAYLEQHPEFEKLQE